MLQRLCSIHVHPQVCQRIPAGQDPTSVCSGDRPHQGRAAERQSAGSLTAPYQAVQDMPGRMAGRALVGVQCNARCHEQKRMHELDSDDTRIGHAPLSALCQDLVQTLHSALVLCVILDIHSARRLLPLQAFSCSDRDKSKVTRAWCCRSFTHTHTHTPGVCSNLSQAHLLVCEQGLAFPAVCTHLLCMHTACAAWRECTLDATQCGLLLPNSILAL